MARWFALRDWRLVINQLAVSALAFGFFMLFSLFKHDPQFQPGAPFIEDPYDAIGSFAVVSLPFILLLGWWRVFVSLIKPSVGQGQDFARNSQVAVAASVVVAAGADLVALGKVWFAGPWSSAHALAFEIVSLLFVVALLATIILARPVAVRGWTWRNAAGPLVLIAVLAAFPDAQIKVVSVHVLTLFALIPLYFWAVSAIVGYFAAKPLSARDAAMPRRFHRWAIVLGLSLGVGGLIALSEWSEGVGLPGHLFRTILLLALFVFTTASCIVVGYAFLRKPLGL